MEVPTSPSHFKSSWNFNNALIDESQTHLIKQLWTNFKDKNNAYGMVRYEFGKHGEWTGFNQLDYIKISLQLARRITVQIENTFQRLSSHRLDYDDFFSDTLLNTWASTQAICLWNELTKSLGKKAPSLVFLAYHCTASSSTYKVFATPD